MSKSKKIVFLVLIVVSFFVFYMRDKGETIVPIAKADRILSIDVTIAEVRNYDNDLNKAKSAGDRN